MENQFINSKFCLKKTNKTVSILFRFQYLLQSFSIRVKQLSLPDTNIQNRTVSGRLKSVNLYLLINEMNCKIRIGTEMKLESIEILILIINHFFFYKGILLLTYFSIPGYPLYNLDVTSV